MSDSPSSYSSTASVRAASAVRPPSWEKSSIRTVLPVSSTRAWRLPASGGQRLPGPGIYEIRGLAWSGRGLVRRVEVSTDGGKAWRDARLQEPVLPLAHMRFRLDWQWDGREAVLQSRCTDETGYVQPTLAALVGVRGLDSFYFNNAIQSWKVAADGSVHNVHA